MAKTKGAREPPSKIAKSAAASAKKVEDPTGKCRRLPRWPARVSEWTLP